MNVPFAIDRMCPMVRTDPQTINDEEGFFFHFSKLLTKGCRVLRGRASAPAALAGCGQQAPGPVEQDTLTRLAEPCPLPPGRSAPPQAEAVPGSGEGGRRIFPAAIIGHTVTGDLLPRAFG